MLLKTYTSKNTNCIELFAQDAGLAYVVKQGLLEKHVLSHMFIVILTTPISSIKTNNENINFTS